VNSVLLPDGRHFWTRWWAFGSYKRWGICWPLKSLSASHEGLISMELVHWELLSNIKTRFLFWNYPIRISAGSSDTDTEIFPVLPKFLRRQYLSTRHDCPLPSFHLISIYATFRVHSMLYIKLMQLKNQPAARPIFWAGLLWARCQIAASTSPQFMRGWKQARQNFVRKERFGDDGIKLRVNGIADMWIHVMKYKFSYLFYKIRPKFWILSYFFGLSFHFGFSVKKRTLLKLFSAMGPNSSH
jgi:hypothetical protein